MIRQTGLALTVSSVLAAGLYLLLVQLGIGKGFPRSAFIIDWGISLAAHPRAQTGGCIGLAIKK